MKGTGWIGPTALNQINILLIEKVWKVKELFALVVIGFHAKLKARKNDKENIKRNTIDMY